MSFLDKCKSLLLDPHPERDETHAATRYALDRAHCPAQPCPGANPALCGVCTDTRKPLSVAKPLYERELPLVDTPAQDTLAEREIDLERRIDSFAELEDADRKEGNESRADVWRNLREKAEAKRRRQHSHAEAH